MFGLQQNNVCVPKILLTAWTNELHMCPTLLPLPAYTDSTMGADVL